MKLSERRKEAIYCAIHEQVIQARIQIQKQPLPIAADSLDFRISQLVDPIYRDVCKILEGKKRA